MWKLVLLVYVLGDAIQMKLNIRRQIKKKVVLVLTRPTRKHVFLFAYLMEYLSNTENFPFRICMDQPLPEAGMKLKAIMVPVGRDEDIGVQKVHDYFSLKLSANASKVET